MSRVKKQEKPAVQREPLQILIDRDARTFATFLTKQSERFSQAQKKIIVLTFGVLAAVAALALIVSPFTSSTTGVRKPSNTLAAYPRPPKHRAPIGIQPSVQAYTAELRALDSLYRSDPKRFARTIEQRLKGVDSLKHDPIKNTP